MGTTTGDVTTNRLSLINWSMASRTLSRSVLIELAAEVTEASITGWNSARGAAAGGDGLSANAAAIINAAMAVVIRRAMYIDPPRAMLRRRSKAHDYSKSTVRSRPPAEDEKRSYFSNVN